MHVSSPLYDASALRQVEMQATQALGGDGFELMRRAGEAAWRWVLQCWPQAMRIVVACGPGNNGGDGYAFACQVLASGREVLVLRPAGAEPRQAQAKRACADYVASGGRIAMFSESQSRIGLKQTSSLPSDSRQANVEQTDGPLPLADLYVDALFGIGLSRAPDSTITALIDALNASGKPILALDVPSGINADTGARPGAAIRADSTLEFIAQRPGLRTGAALDCVGATRLATLELPLQAWHGITPCADWIEPTSLGQRLPARLRNSHKGSHGHVLCVGGDRGAGGAIVLCAQGALRAGAGLVSAITRPDHVPALLAHVPECMARGFSMQQDECLDADADADEIAALIARADVVALGPGLGSSAWGRRLYDLALTSGKPLVLDADGLNLLAATPQLLPAAVLTPHPGEASRLLGCPIVDVQNNRYRAAHELATRFGCTVVLKGAGTVVAAPEARSTVIVAGNPGMATGGMGDVLTGVIASLLAQAHAPFDAATTGALLHAHAGDLAARAGERGLTPSDVLASLRAAANPSAS